LLNGLSTNLSAEYYTLQPPSVLSNVYQTALQNKSSRTAWACC